MKYISPNSYFDRNVTDCSTLVPPKCPNTWHNIFSFAICHNSCQKSIHTDKATNKRTTSLLKFRKYTICMDLSDEMLLLLREHSNEVVSLICISWDILGLRYMWRLLLTIPTLRNRYCVFQSWHRSEEYAFSKLSIWRNFHIGGWDGVKTKIDNKWEHLVSILKTSRGHLKNVFKTSVDTWEHLENIWNIWERL